MQAMDPARLDRLAASLSINPVWGDVNDTEPSIPLFDDDERDAIRPSLPTYDALPRAGLRPRRSSARSTIAFLVLIASTIAGGTLAALHLLGVDSTAPRKRHTHSSPEPAGAALFATANEDLRPPGAPSSVSADGSFASNQTATRVAAAASSLPTIGRAATFQDVRTAPKAQARSTERPSLPINPYGDHASEESARLPKRL
jgi:hypothetical protein